MVWTTPRTWVAGEKPTASQMNQHIRDNFNWLFAGSGWQACTSIAPFTVNGVEVRRVGALVVMRGYITRASSFSATLTDAAQLPSGYYPPVDHYFAPGQPLASVGVRGAIASGTGRVQIGMEAANTGGMGVATAWFID